MRAVRSPAWLLALAGCGRISFSAVDVVDSTSTQSITLALDRFDATAVLLDFPLRVVLEPARYGMADDGSDVRFFASDGTPLPAERDELRTSISWWVRVPRIEGTSTTLRVAF